MAGAGCGCICRCAGIPWSRLVFNTLSGSGFASLSGGPMPLHLACAFIWQQRGCTVRALTSVHQGVWLRTRTCLGQGTSLSRGGHWWPPASCSLISETVPTPGLRGMWRRLPGHPGFPRDPSVRLCGPGLATGRSRPQASHGNRPVIWPSHAASRRSRQAKKPNPTPLPPNRLPSQKGGQTRNTPTHQPGNTNESVNNPRA